MLLREQRDRRGHLRRRERGPVDHQVAGLDVVRVGREHVERGTGELLGDDVPAGRHDLRLHEAVGGDAVRRERGDAVVCGRRGVVQIGSADGDDERVVAGRVVDGVRTEVARARDHDEAGAPGGLDRLVERARLVRARDRLAEREVDRLDAALLAVRAIQSSAAMTSLVRTPLPESTLNAYTVAPGAMPT